MQAPSRAEGRERQSIELAATGERQDHLLAGEQIIIVELDGTPYGIPIEFVQEVEQVPSVAPVPHTADWLHGVVNLRGSILTLVDPANLLEVGVWRRSATARMLVVGRDDPAALAVDRLLGMRRLTEQVAPEVAGDMPGRVAEFVTAIYRDGDDFISVLDIRRLLDDAERVSNQLSDLVSISAGGRLPGGDVSVQERGA
jgi:purine-binding chemotaxis protein CheW